MKKYLIILFILFIYSSHLLFSQTKIDSLESQLEKAADIEKVEVLNELTKVYLNKSPQKALDYSNQALELSERLDYIKGKAEALKNIGAGNYYLSNYDKSLEYYLNSLKIMEEIGDKEGISILLNNIGVVYWKMGSFDKALAIYTESLKIMKEMENKEGIARSLNNIGLIYMTLENYDKALEYFIKTLKLMKEIGNKNNIAYCLNNIGIIYWYLENYNKSLEYYLESLKINKEINNKYGVAGSLKNIGGTYLKLKNYDNSLAYLEQSLKLAKEIEAKDLIQNIYATLTDLYAVKANYKKALEYFKKYSEVKDSIFTEESSKKIAEMQTKYETEKKEKENEILRKDNEIQKLEITRQQNLRNSFIIISVLILILVFVIYNRYRAKQKANKILSEKNLLITKQKNQLSKTLEELRDTQKTLVEVAHRAGMAEIATGILHNVGNVLNSVKVSSQILKERIKKSKINSLQKALNLMKQHTDDLGNYISSDEKGKMLPTYLLEVGKVLEKEQDTSLKELSNLHSGINHIEEIVSVQQNYAGVSGIVESISLSKMMDDVLRMYQETFIKYKIKVIKDYKETPPISIEKGKLMQVFVNLLKNAQESLMLKGDEDKTITINISEDKEKKSQIIEIIDNGIGIPKDNLDKIFSYGFTTKKGSKGFGLHTSALTMAELKGKLTAESDGVNKGAKFNVIVPESRPNIQGELSSRGAIYL